MAQKPIVMEQIKQILFLHKQNIPIREIARRTGVSRNSIKKYLRHACEQKRDTDTSQQIEHTHDSPEQATGHTLRLEQLEQYIQAHVSELTRTGVTRYILWREYRRLYGDGYGYSQFCFHWSSYLKQKDVVMHLEYKPGDVIMIDFAGKKLSYLDRTTGELVSCEIFVSILPLSGLIFCMAVSSHHLEKQKAEPDSGAVVIKQDDRHTDYYLEVTSPAKAKKEQGIKDCFEQRFE